MENSTGFVVREEEKEIKFLAYKEKGEKREDSTDGRDEIIVCLASVKLKDKDLGVKRSTQRSHHAVFQTNARFRLCSSQMELLGVPPTSQHPPASPDWVSTSLDTPSS
uniref:Uncharacterized protein n=1 Tax=Vespula pensylvanica TaxID=30213 RepID=A0A834UF59_VESPE|nr:hypothetical protein H0235_003649 [Vespula pensylvanica]